MGWLKRLLSRRRQSAPSPGDSVSPESEPTHAAHTARSEYADIPRQLDETLAKLKQGVASAADVTIRPLSLRPLEARMALVFCSTAIPSPSWPQPRSPTSTARARTTCRPSGRRR